MVILRANNFETQAGQKTSHYQGNYTKLVAITLKIAITECVNLTVNNAKVTPTIHNRGGRHFGA